MNVRVVIDSSICAMIGMCEAVDPDVFEIVGASSTVIPDYVERSIAEEAVAQCPVGAISIIDAAGG
jgi:ferredoxin